MRSDIVQGAVFPDYELPDHTAKRRKLSELQGQHPMVLVLSRGGFCPKDRRQAEGLVALHRELEVGYCRLVTISTDNIAGAILIRLGDVVGANRDQPAIANLQLTMECNKPFSLPAVLGAEASAAEDEDHWMLSLQFRELPAFRGVVGKLVVGEDSPWNNVRSHMKSLTVGCASPGCVSNR